MNLLAYQNFYLIGIKGVGMTMLAQFLSARGKSISGVDLADVFMTDQVLRRAHIPVRVGFDSSKIPARSVIIYSSAYTPDNNLELNYLFTNTEKFKKYPVLNYAQAISALFNTYQGIAVCGSHGKTTTAAWLGFVLKQAGLDPNVLVGARVPQFQGSALVGKSNYFIAEADEYQNKLQYLQPRGIVLNNIDFDHPDYFKNKRAYFRVFADFIAKLKTGDFLVANAADVNIRRLLPQVKGKIFTYALADKLGRHQAPVSLLGHSLRREGLWQYFQVNDWGEFKICLLGKHNIENALAVLASGLALGFDPLLLKKFLAAFKGTARRSELIGHYQNIPVFDDYGHHPTEVQTTLQAFKEAYPDKRLVVLFHPHTFTRTQALFPEFVASFAAADVLGILEIYGSAREKQGGISSRDLVKAIKYAGRKKPAVYLSDFDKSLIWLRKILHPDDLLLLMGAGDIFRVGERLLDKK
jgi:UDP-N-acetylmuramate--alanine ligase